MIYPYVADAVKEVAAYRTHFKIKRPVAIQCVVVSIARRCKQASREDLRKLFKLGTLMTGLRRITDFEAE